MTDTVPGGVIWVCLDCMLAREGDGPTETPDCEPWSLIGDDVEITAGMVFEEHYCSDPGEQECDCERIEFSWGTCQGCGSTLGGERYAYTYWVDRH